MAKLLQEKVSKLTVVHVYKGYICVYLLVMISSLTGGIYNIIIYTDLRFILHS